LNSQEIILSGILELYVLGQTSAEETKQVLEWKALYKDVAAELDSIETSLEQYAMANSIPLPVHVKNNLFRALPEQANNTSTVNNVPSNTDAGSKQIRKWQWLAAASFLLFVGSAIALLFLFNRYQHNSNKLAKASQELLQKEKSNLTLQKNLDAITASNSQSIVLNGTENAPSSSAKIFWIKNTGDLFVAPSGLPAAPVGMQYQLWAIVDGQPVDAGLLLPDNSGSIYSVQKMKSFGKAEAFAITLEKSGGSTSPAGKMVVMSKT
jgi:anti-sigma-K factor RskA